MNGLCIQWGKANITQNVGTKINYNLTAQYTQPPVVIITPKTSGLDQSGRSLPQVYDVNTGYFYGFYNTAKPDNFNWIAIGY